MPQRIVLEDDTGRASLARHPRGHELPTTMTVYKLLRLRKDGTLGPLFINRAQRIPVGPWLEAESHPTPGYAVRPGWHCVGAPSAPHLSTRGRVWCRVQIQRYTSIMRPVDQGGLWFLAQRMRVDEVLAHVMHLVRA